MSCETGTKACVPNRPTLPCVISVFMKSSRPTWRRLMPDERRIESTSSQNTVTSAMSWRPSSAIATISSAWPNRFRRWLGSHARHADHATLKPSDEASDCPLTIAGDHFAAKVRRFGDYELLEEIGRGGMGVVYKARQTSLQRIVALKMILAGQLASQEEVRRLHTEAEAAANLDHPGIVPIYEVGEHDGQHYFSMGYVEGYSLAVRLREGPVPSREAAELLVQVCEAAQYAHEHGVIHRDLKPANILLEENRESRADDSDVAAATVSAASSGSPSLSLGSRPRITDFGLAKRMTGDSQLTATGQILGTPSYMAPEHAAGTTHCLGPASDVYSLGAVLYHLLTGRPPFQAETPLDTLLQVLDSDPVPPRLLNRGVPRDLEAVCMKCLDKDPARRYLSARDLRDELQRYLDGDAIHASGINLLDRMTLHFAAKSARRALSRMGSWSDGLRAGDFSVARGHFLAGTRVARSVGRLLAAQKCDVRCFADHAVAVSAPVGAADQFRRASDLGRVDRLCAGPRRRQLGAVRAGRRPARVVCVFCSTCRAGVPGHGRSHLGRRVCRGPRVPDRCAHLGQLHRRCPAGIRRTMGRCIGDLRTTLLAPRTRRPNHRRRYEAVAGPTSTKILEFLRAIPTAVPAYLNGATNSPVLRASP